MKALLKGAAAAAAASVFATASADVVADFSQVEQTWGVEVSPDGSKVAFGCVMGERRAICVSGLDAPTTTIMPPSDGADINEFYWINNQHVFVSASFVERETMSSGVEDIRFTRGISFDTDSGKSTLLMRNVARTMSNTGYISSILTEDDDHVLMGGYKVNVKSGNARVYGKYSGYTSAPILDAAGRELVRVKFRERKGDFEVRDPDNRLIFERSDAPLQPFFVVAGSADGASVIIRGDGSDPEIGRGIHRMSLDTGEISTIVVDGADMTGAAPITDRHTGAVVGYWYRRHVSYQMFVDEELAARQAMISESLGDAVVHLTSWSKDRSRITVAASRPGEPTTYYLFETDPLALGLLGEAYPALAGKTFGQVEYVEYPARDGLEIPGYLTLPPGKSRQDGPFPLLLLPHGGPDAYDTAAYDWWSQAYAAAGYAVLQPNFRGSAGYGAAFREAGFGEFGGKMITDTIDGAAWLEAEGVAAPGGACIVGSSYGGYAALMAPLHDAGRIRCAISVSGVTDPIAQMGRYATYGGSRSEIISYWEQYMGDLYASEEAQSEITPAERVSEYTVPVLLMHGDEDTRVPYAQAERFRGLAEGRPWFSFVRMRGEDHFLFTQSARKTMLSESLAFLSEHHPAR